VPGLLAMLRSASPSGRAGAAQALGSVGGLAAEGAVPEVLDILAREPEVVVRRQIAQALFHLLLRQDVTSWNDRLALALRDPDVEVRDWIARGLTHAGPAAAPLAGELAGCLASEDESLQGHALDVLAKIGPEAGAALPAVMPLIRSPSTEVQLLALRAAWAINGDRPPHFDEMLDALMKLARAPEVPKRTAAMRQLGAIAAGLAPSRPQRQWAMAMLIAGRSDPDNKVRDAADLSLHRIESDPDAD
jgi:HEAT repeat protein